MIIRLQDNSLNTSTKKMVKMIASSCRAVKGSHYALLIASSTQEEYLVSRLVGQDGGREERMEGGRRGHG